MPAAAARRRGLLGATAPLVPYATQVAAEPSLKSYWRLGSSPPEVDQKGVVNLTSIATDWVANQPGLLAGDPSAKSFLMSNTGYYGGLQNASQDHGYNFWGGDESFSVEFWMKLKAFQSYPFATADAGPLMVGAESPARGGFANWAWGFTLPNDGSFTFWYNGATPGKCMLAAGSITVGPIYHVVGTFRDADNSLRLYLNGVLVSGPGVGSYQAVVTPVTAPPTDKLIMGMDAAGQYPFPVWMQDVAIYTDEIASGVVSNHYAAGVTP